MKKMSPNEIKAKMSVLEELMNMASGAEGDDLEGHFKGLQKVTIAAPDKKGLAEGLDKAEDMMSSPDDEEMHESLNEDMKDMNSEDELSLPDESKDPEELDEDMDMKKLKMKNMPSKKKKGYLSSLV